MPRLTRIYTRTGDQGETSLGSGQRVPKDHPRIEAYGTVDELNASLGLAAALDPVPALQPMLVSIRNTLFHLGSDLCFPEEDKAKVAIPQVEARHVAELERWMDTMQEELEPLSNFVLPGGTKAAAQLHVARTICRRAERVVLELMHHERVGAHALPFLNRLSDLLFVMSRYENKQRGTADVLWDSRA